MLGYQLLYLISLVTFTFGALTFSVLTLFYWRQRRLRPRPAGGAVFPAFTVACAAAFLMNLLLRTVAAGSEDSAAATGLSMALDLATGMLPPLLLHLIYRDEEPGLPARGAWRCALVLFYLASAATAVAKGLSDANVLDDRWSDRLDSVPALRLAVAGILGLAIQVLSRRHTAAAERRHRWWNRVLLGLTVLVAALNLAQAPPIWGLLPDYLLLGFFCVTLYYKERLIFFDLLIKRGAFFAVAVAGLTFFFATAPPVLERLPADWSRPWIAALLLTPLWLAAPWIYGRLTGTIDHVWLRRRYTPAEAERQFVHAVQVAGTDAGGGKLCGAAGAIGQHSGRLDSAPGATRGAPRLDRPGRPAELGPVPERRSPPAAVFGTHPERGDRECPLPPAATAAGGARAAPPLAGQPRRASRPARRSIPTSCSTP